MIPLRSVFLAASLSSLVLAAGTSGCGGGGGTTPPPPSASRLSADAPAGQGEPDVAFDSAGNAIAVWVERHGDSGRVLWARYTAASSTWSAEEEWVTSESDSVRAAVASNGTGFLVAWSVGCAIDVALSEGEGWSAPVRLSNGCPLEPLGAGSDGVGYAVAWTQPLGARRVVYASVFDGTSWHEDPAGEVSSVPLSGEEGDATSFAMAAGAAGYAVAWAEHGSAGEALSVNVFEDGAWQQDELGAPAPTRLASGARWVPRPAIASDGEGYAVVWVQRDDGYHDDAFASVRSGTGWAAPVPLEQESTPAMAPAVASNGSGYAAVWLHWTGEAAELRANVLAGGAWQAASAVVAAQAHEDSIPAVIASGPDYLVAWLAPGPAEAALSSLHREGSWGAHARLDAASGGVRPVRLAPAATGPAAIFPQDDASGANRIFVNRWSGGGWAGAHDLVTGVRESAARSARVAASGLGETLALWTQYRNGVPEVAGRLHRAGSWQPVEVIARPAAEAVLATDGAGFLAAWVSEDDGTVRARRWTDGAWSEAERLSPVGRSAASPAVASDGRGYAVAWMAYSSDTWTIAMARFDGTAWEEDGAGAVLATRVDVHGSAMSPALASNGVGYCVTWSSFALGEPRARIHDGTSWQPAPVSLARVLPGNLLAVASDGHGYAAVWNQRDGERWDVYANVFDGASWQEDAGVPAPTLIEELDGSADRPVVASNGAGYAVAWIHRDAPMASSVRAILFDGTSWQAEGGHPAVARLEVDMPMSGHPVIASDGAGYAVVWGQTRPEPLLLLSRHDGTRWSSSASGAPEPTTIEIGAGREVHAEAITSSGRGYSLVWQKQDEPGRWDTPEIWALPGI